MLTKRIIPVIAQQEITPTRQPKKDLCLRDFIRSVEDLVNVGSCRSSSRLSNWPLPVLAVYSDTMYTLSPPGGGGVTTCYEFRVSSAESGLLALCAGGRGWLIYWLRDMILSSSPSSKPNTLELEDAFRTSLICSRWNVDPRVLKLAGCADVL